MIKAIIFDCDGTLVDSEGLSNQALVLSLLDYGVHEKEEDLISRYRGGKLATVMDSLQSIHNIRFSDDFVTKYRATVEELFKTHLKPIEGIPSLLNKLKKLNIPMCVASSGPMEKIQTSLTTTKIIDYFEGKIYSAYDIKSWKPDPDLFLHASRSLGVKPENCLVIEDSEVGIIGANRANMKALLFDPKDEINIQDGYSYTLIKSMDEVLDFLSADSN